MSITEMDSVKSFLKSKHIFANQDWLEECVKYISHVMSKDMQKVKEITVQQWLLNDLKKVSSGCLPPNLKLEPKIVLKDKYMLQINSEIDIGVSSYQQYCKLTNVNDEDVEATLSAEERIPSHRMLKLSLTDGKQDIFGIEYRSISKIKTSLIPGSKVLITGPVVCRSGILFLDNNSIDVMGGEVEELSNINTKIEILALKLGLSQVSPTTNKQQKQQPEDRASKKTEPLIENRAQKIEPLIENIAQKTKPLIENRAQKTEPLIENIAQKTKPLIENRAQKTEPLIENIAQKTKPLIDSHERLSPHEPLEKRRRTLSNEPCNDMGLNACKDHVKIVSSNPFIYIKQINDMNESSKMGKTCRVKAQILYLLKKPFYFKDSWMVECKISDGTGCLNVQIDSDWFSELVLYTPQKMAELNKKRLLNPEEIPKINRDLVKKLGHAMKKLKSLYCIMELMILPTPVIKKIIPFEKEHVILINKRLQGL